MNDNTIAVLDFELKQDAEHLNQRLGDLFSSIGEANPNRIIDEAKNLLETVFRTIIVDKTGSVEEGRRAATFPNLYTQAKDCISLSNEPDAIDKINELCEKAVLIIGHIRNSYGNAHGRDGYSTNNIDLAESLFFARIAISITNLLYGKHINSPIKHLNNRIKYEDYNDFNEYFDEAEGPDIVVGGIPLRPSEVLFNGDLTAYREYLIEFMNQPPESSN